MHLFDTDEYKMLEKIKNRLKFINTENNRSKYNEYLIKCSAIAKKDNNFGWDNHTKNYFWNTLKNSDLGPNMISYDEEVSPIKGYKIFIAEDESLLVLSSKTNIINFSKQEVESIKNVSTEQFIKLFKLKVSFEGEIQNVKIERSRTVKKNSDLFKFPSK